MYIKKYNGFTMLELVLVIIIITVLTAFALPRYADVTVDAKNVTSASIAASLNSSLSMLATKFQLVSSNPNTDIIINLNDYPITVNNGSFSNAYTLTKQGCITLVTSLITNVEDLEITNLGTNACKITGNGINVKLTRDNAVAISS